MIALDEAGSHEEIALFNPAFLARILHGAVDDYVKAAGRSMPIPLAFLVTPLVLHKETRSDLPRSAASQMQNWIRENPRYAAHVTSRVVGLRVFTGVALRFGLTHGVLLADDGLLAAGSLRRRPSGFGLQETVEIEECLKAGRLVGRWFARQPDTATLLAWWGLTA